MKKDQEEIQKELKELGVELEAGVPMPFSVPSAYFDEAKNNIFETVLALDFVEELPKRMPQLVPNGYFDEMQAAVFGQIHASTSSNKLISSPGIRKTWALAASIALIVSIGLFFINPPATSIQSIENQLSAISTDQIKGYLEEKSYNLEALDILENPTISSKELQDLESEIIDATKTLSDEEIFVYAL